MYGVYCILEYESERGGSVLISVCKYIDLDFFLELYDRASRSLLMNETNRCIVNFQFLLMAQYLYMFRAVFLPIIRSVISCTTALVQFHAAR